MDQNTLYYAQSKIEWDNDPDPYKRRKKNIKIARKQLKPARRFGFIKFNQKGQCCVSGIMLASLGPSAFDVPLLDPDTFLPLENGKTLASQFFRDPLTGKTEPFYALSNVDTGFQLGAGYSPDLLMIYWLFSQWKYQQHMDNQSQHSVWLWKRRKIKMVPINPEKAKKSKPKLVEAMEPFYQMCLEHQGNGIEISEFKNFETGEVDICTIHMDLRHMRYLEEQAKGSFEGTTSEA